MMRVRNKHDYHTLPSPLNVRKTLFRGGKQMKSQLLFHLLTRVLRTQIRATFRYAAVDRQCARD